MQRDLNNPLIFVKVVELGSFAAAARTLGVPNSTVSRKLRELEERLGTRLLNRTTRRLALTEAGTIYYEHCKRIATDLDEAENAVQQLGGAPRGWLRITAPYTVTVTTLAPILHDFRRRYPDVQVDVVLSNERLDLVAHDIDVAIRFGSLPDSSLVARRLASFSTHIYASEGYLSRHGEPESPEELEQHHALVHAHYRRGQGYAWPLRNGSAEREAPVTPVVVANDPQVLQWLLAADGGLMLTTGLNAQCFMEPIRVRRVLTSWRGPDVDLNAVFMGGRVLSPKVRVFVDFVAEQIQGWCTDGASLSECQEKHAAWARPECAAVGG